MNKSLVLAAVIAAAALVACGKKEEMAAPLRHRHRLPRPLQPLLKRPRTRLRLPLALPPLQPLPALRPPLPVLRPPLPALRPPLRPMPQRALPMPPRSRSTLPRAPPTTLPKKLLTLPPLRSRSPDISAVADIHESHPRVAFPFWASYG